MPRPPKPTDMLDKLKHLLGTMHDRDIAAMTNGQSTPGNVRDYRRKYGIEAFRGPRVSASMAPASEAAVEPQGTPAEASATVETSLPPGRRRIAPNQPSKGEPQVWESNKDKKVRKARSSKLDRFADRIGKESDETIAIEAGVTAGAVKAYRNKHEIALDPAADRRRKRQPEAPEAEVQDASVAPDFSKLEAFAEHIGQVPDDEIATLAEVDIALVAAFRESRDIPEHVEKAEKSEPAEVKRVGRKSKLEAYHDEIGTVPNSVIAEKAGVQLQSVRAYIRQHGLDRYVKPEAPPRKKNLVQVEPERRAKRAYSSKLDPYKDELGKVPDKIIAEKAGVTVHNVRGYRKYHGIELSVEAGGRPNARGRTPANKSGREAASEVHESGSTTVEFPAPRLMSGQERKRPDAVKPSEESKDPKPGFAVQVSCNGVVTDYVVLARDVVRAAKKGREALESGIIKGEIIGVRYLGPSLGVAAKIKTEEKAVG